MSKNENKYIDELIDDRKQARSVKNWKLSDEIRDCLDSKLVFIFDAKWGQEVYYLPEKYFEKHKSEIMSKRQYVEMQIKKNINAENNFDSWLYSMQKRK